MPAGMSEAWASSSMVNESVCLLPPCHAFRNECGSCLGSSVTILVKTDCIDFYLCLLFMFSYGFSTNKTSETVETGQGRC